MTESILDLRERFAASAATILGTAHLAAVRNNQDGFCVLETPNAIVGVIADGCSGGHHSEVGARLFATIAARALACHVFDDGSIGWENARTEVVNAIYAVLSLLANTDAPPPRQAARDADQFLMFTLVAFVITPTVTQVAAIGDGYAEVNGAPLPIARAADNHPIYLTYDVLGSSLPPERLKWQVVADIPTDTLESLIIGSDGLHDLADAAEKLIPHTEAVAGPPSQFVGAAHARNRDLARRRLTLINGGLDPRGLRPGGLLPDDTTVIAVQRRPAPPEAR